MRGHSNAGLWVEAAGRLPQSALAPALALRPALCGLRSPSADSQNVDVTADAPTRATQSVP